MSIMASIELPDFDEMMDLVEKITDLSKKKTLLEIRIKVEEANVTKTMTEDEKYYVKGKPPTQTYIDNSLKHTGFDGEILEMRNELAEVSADLERAKKMFELSKLIIDVWRTESANERTVFE